MQEYAEVRGGSQSMEAQPKLAAAALQQSSFEQHFLEEKLALLQKDEIMMQERHDKSKENYSMQLKANEAHRSL